MGFFSPNVNKLVDSAITSYHAASVEFDNYPFANEDELRAHLGVARVKDMTETLRLADGILDENDIIRIFTDFAQEMRGKLPSYGPKGRRNPFNDVIVENVLDPSGFQMFKFVSRGVGEEIIEVNEKVAEGSKEVFTAFGKSIKFTGIAASVLLPGGLLVLGYFWLRRLMPKD